MNRPYIFLLLAAAITLPSPATSAETPFSGSDVQVTDDGAVPANAGSGSGSAGSSYTVRSGDSLSAIARRLLGDASRYIEIVNLNAGRYPSLRNNPDLIHPGWNLTIPGGSTAPSNSPATSGSYTVRSGDSLSAIAQRCLGNGGRYMEIVNLNADRYPSLRSNPNLIHPGWTLRLPSGANPGSTPTPAPSNPAPSNPGANESAELNAWQGGRLSPERFCALLGPVAAASFRATGVPASVTLAQAALETGWGAATIGNAKNLFGIKGTGPAGSITVSTQEYVNGRYITVNDSFRKYNTWQESFDDHAKLITQASRYANCMNNKNNPDQFARELQKAGYATDPEYANKLISIMRANNLYQYDK
ncbi:MAG TPA: glucosaminidase domain-containing protein [Candidatus Ozemobacteraceae bacterium]|nr:glucosaminidase domain-containing protein [Candidatus Ozemobacteraceae bacterium]